MAKNNRQTPPKAARTPKAPRPQGSAKQPFYKRYALILGDVVLGVGVSALANNFDEIVRFDIETLKSDRFVVLFAILAIVVEATIKNEGGKRR